MKPTGPQLKQTLSKLYNSDQLSKPDLMLIATGDGEGQWLGPGILLRLPISSD